MARIEKDKKLPTEKEISEYVEHDRWRREYQAQTAALGELVPELENGFKRASDGSVLTGVTIKLTTDGDCLAILRRRRYETDGAAHHEVAFTNSYSFVGVLAAIEQCLREELYKWRADEYAPNRRASGSLPPHLR